MVREQGSLALAQEGDCGIVGGQVLVFGRHGSSILVDRVEEAVGRDPAFLPVSPLCRESLLGRIS